MQPLFGEANQVYPEDGRSRAQCDLPPQESPKVALTGWTGDLLAVDEDLTMRLWRRLLADANALQSLRCEPLLKSLAGAMKSPYTIPPDMNASYIARNLVDISDSSSALPFGVSSSMRSGSPIRVKGPVSNFRKVANGWTMTLGRSPEGALVRFHENVFIHHRPRGLVGQDVLVLGIIETGRRLELTGIVLLICNSK